MDAGSMARALWRDGLVTNHAHAGIIASCDFLLAPTFLS